MRAQLNTRAVDATVIITAKLQLVFEPGAWVVQEDDVECTVSALAGLIDSDGAVHFTIPKGYAKRPNGFWGAKERLLHRAIPLTNPAAAWAALPPAVRDLIEDSYLLARDETPELIGAQL